MTFEEFVKKVKVETGTWYDFDMVRNAVKNVKPDFYLANCEDWGGSLIYVLNDDELMLKVDYNELDYNFTVFCEVVSDNDCDIRRLGAVSINVHNLDKYERKSLNVFYRGGVSLWE